MATSQAKFCKGNRKKAWRAGENLARTTKYPNIRAQLLNLTSHVLSNLSHHFFSSSLLASSTLDRSKQTISPPSTATPAGVPRRGEVIRACHPPIRARLSVRARHALGSRDRETHGAPTASSPRCRGLPRVYRPAHDSTRPAP